MKELGFKESFALVALNGLDPDQMTTAKKIALRSIIAAEKLEKFLDGQNDITALMQELKGIPKITVGNLKKAEKELVSSFEKRELI